MCRRLYETGLYILERLILLLLHRLAFGFSASVGQQCRVFDFFG